MPDSGDPRVLVCTAYALWPGEGFMCVRVSVPKIADMLILVDRENRRSELRVFRYGEWRRRG